MTINEKIEKCLAFIRYAIDPERHKAPEMSENDWLRLYDFAFKQAILGVAFEGLNHYQVQGSAPSLDFIMKWGSRTLSLKRKNAATNKAVVKLVEQLEKDGFKCCVLKGQGNNLLYPNVYSRKPGDIDIWVAKAGDTKSNVRDIIKYVRCHNPKGRAIYHHIDYGLFEKIDVEVHYRPSFMNNLIHNHRLQKWFKQQADTQFENRVELPDNAGTIIVPTVEFNAVYQLIHIYQHVINKGIGLRHIIDYYYVLTALKDKSEIEQTIRYLGLENIAGAVMWALVKMLGMESEYLIAAPDERLGRMLANMILHDGDFSPSSKDRQSLMRIKGKSKWRLKLDRNIQRLKFDIRLIRYFPSECLWEPIFRLYHFLWRRMI